MHPLIERHLVLTRIIAWSIILAAAAGIYSLFAFGDDGPSCNDLAAACDDDRDYRPY